jgi:hypothetical protein
MDIPLPVHAPPIRIAKAVRSDGDSKETQSVAALVLLRISASFSSDLPNRNRTVQTVDDRVRYNARR